MKIIQKKRFLRLLFSSIQMSAIFFIVATEANSNTLLNSVKLTNKSISVPVNLPDDLNFQSRVQILSKRKRIIEKEKGLSASPYKATPGIFDFIVDRRPWWGMYGTFVWGAGPRSIEGPAEESRFILNPFLLVAANPNTALIWDQNKITNDDLKDPSFPFCWLPTSLTWYPSESLAQVVYPVTEFNHQVELRKQKLLYDYSRLKLNLFGIIAYNARDFGFNYVYVDIAKSINIVNANNCHKPVLLTQLIHCGNTSKYPGGCNNMSPAIPEIDRFAISRLPARACIYLWHNQPSSINQKADFTFYMDFR